MVASLLREALTTSVRPSQYLVTKPGDVGISRRRVWGEVRVPSHDAGVAYPKHRQRKPSRPWTPEPSVKLTP